MSDIEITKRKQRFDQAAVNEVRQRVEVQIVVSCSLQDLDPPAPQHLWFPEPHTRAYALRPGNAPADRDRPKHLRRLDLAVWVKQITPTTRQLIKALKHEANQGTEKDRQALIKNAAHIAREMHREDLMRYQWVSPALPEQPNEPDPERRWESIISATAQATGATHLRDRIKRTK